MRTDCHSDAVYGAERLLVLVTPVLEYQLSSKCWYRGGKRSSRRVFQGKISKVL